MRQEAEQRQAVFEEQKALEERLQISYKQNHDNIVQATRKSLDKVREFEEILKSRGAERTEQVRIVITFPRANSDEVEDAEKFLEELRMRNPEWETRRQAALRVSICLLISIHLLTLVQSVAKNGGIAHVRRSPTAVQSPQTESGRGCVTALLSYLV